MSLTFTYQDKKGCRFDYEVDKDKVRQALARMIYNNNFKEMFLNQDTILKKLIIATLEQIIDGYDLQDKLEEDLKEDLKYYFETDAFKSITE